MTRGWGWREVVWWKRRVDSTHFSLEWMRLRLQEIEIESHRLCVCVCVCVWQTLEGLRGGRGGSSDGGKWGASFGTKGGSCRRGDKSVGLAESLQNQQHCAKHPKHGFCPTCSGRKAGERVLVAPSLSLSASAVEQPGQPPKYLPHHYNQSRPAPPGRRNQKNQFYSRYKTSLYSYI